ncbi:MAG: hypothetical protein Wins2KO_17730 [Winogradskyella sp.]
MKIKTIIPTLFIIASCFINGQTFVKVGGVATDIAISPKDESVYIVSNKNVFHNYNKSTKKWKLFGKRTNNVKSISIHPNGSVYMVSQSNEVHINVKGKWIKIPGIKTNEVDIDKDGNIRALNLSGRLHQLIGGKWKSQTKMNASQDGFRQVIGQSKTLSYARFNTNAFHVYKNGRWKKLSGSPLRITMDDKKKIPYAVGRNKGVYMWSLSKNKWELLKNTRKDFKEVAVQNGKIWAITTNNRIYHYASVTATSDEIQNYEGTYRVTFTRVVGYAPELLAFKSVDIYGTFGVYLEAKTSSNNTFIVPLNGKNRVWDISKNYPSAVRPKKTEITLNGKKETFRGELPIGMMREFEIRGEAANEYLTFDIQSNIAQKTAIGEREFKWKRKKMKITDVTLGREYFLNVNPGNWLTDSTYLIGFKIEKR